MTRTVLLAALLASGPAFAQTGDLALAPTAETLRADLGTVMHLAATAALAHDRTGAFPSSPFDLLGRSWSSDTNVRAARLSSLDVMPSGDSEVGLAFVPLPTDPYVREDAVVSVVLRAEAGGVYRAEYQITRRTDPDDGGARLAYDTAGRYRVERATGTFCLDVAHLDALLASDAFVPDPTVLSPAPLTMRVRPPDADTPTFFEVTVSPQTRTAR